MTLPPAAVAMRRIAWKHNLAVPGERMLPDEVPIAFTYNRDTYAVMLASPTDLDDFALGFSLTEGVVRDARDIEDFEIVAMDAGVELRLSLAADRAEAVVSRRRRLAGATGCGLCGIESLAEASRRLPNVPTPARFRPQDVAAAMACLPGAQVLNRTTHAVHAAGFWSPSAGLLALREDVGRHNALDKLAGALAKSGVDLGAGILVLSSRVSVELIQKAAMVGIGVLAAISSPTALAVRQAEVAGITLIGVARSDGFEVFSHAGRIEGEALDDVG